MPGFRSIWRKPASGNRHFRLPGPEFLLVGQPDCGVRSVIIVPGTLFRTSMDILMSV